MGLWLVNCFSSKKKRSNCIVYVQLGLNVILFTKQNWQIEVRAGAAVDCQSYCRNTIECNAATYNFLNRMNSRSVYRVRNAQPIFPYKWNLTFDITSPIHWQLSIDIYDFIIFGILFSFILFVSFWFRLYLFGCVQCTVSIQCTYV